MIKEFQEFIELIMKNTKLFGGSYAFKDSLAQNLKIEDV